MSVSWFIVGVLGIWLIAATIILIKVWRFFTLLSEETNTENIAKLLEKVFIKEETNSKAIEAFAKKIEYFKEKEEIHMQKYGFVRFNPFGDMGGDHSFCLALLNGKQTGFVLTGLHTRERTRVYVKHIKRGKSEYDLSKEEQKALNEALEL
jgi:hypothetical protein